MRKAEHVRIVSTLLIVAFLATSTVARLFSTEAAGHDAELTSLHAKSERPYGGDQPFPFEEKEKEIEDETETESEKNEDAAAGWCLIGDIAPGLYSLHTGGPVDGDHADGTNRHHLPLFLTNRSIVV